MLLVGLTGNIASGKSTVSRMLQLRGADLIDADVLARVAVRPGSPALEKIADRWGSEILNPDGSLDRAALRSRVFSDQDELEALNAIVHPEVQRLRHEQLAEARDRGERIVVSDIPLLFERGLVNDFDVVVLVDAPRPVRLERLVRDRSLHEAEAMQMIAAQMPAELKRARADYVIENDSTLDELEARVDELWEALRSTRPSGAESRIEVPASRAGRDTHTDRGASGNQGHESRAGG